MERTAQDITNVFVQNQRSLVDTLDETANMDESLDALQEFRLESGAIESYTESVYEQADEESIGSCRDVIENGPDSLLGMLDNVAKQFEYMERFIERSQRHKFSERAEQVRMRNGQLYRIQHIQDSLDLLHKDERLLPNIDELDTLNTVLDNLEELDHVLTVFSNAETL